MRKLLIYAFLLWLSAFNLAQAQVSSTELTIKLNEADKNIDYMKDSFMYHLSLLDTSSTRRKLEKNYYRWLASTTPRLDSNLTLNTASWVFNQFLDSKATSTAACDGDWGNEPLGPYVATQQQQGRIEELTFIDGGGQTVLLL